MNKYEQLKSIIESSSKIVFFTGAGISTASNIPDFRSSNGLYSENIGRYSPEEIISHSFFMEHTKEFYEFYFSKMVFPNAKPNLAHSYIANLQDKKEVTVVTQNIDNLHQAAGSKNVIELHGSVHRYFCMNCHKHFDLSEVIKFGGDIPICPTCGGIIKPDVVLYEEPLNENDTYRAIKAISNCDTMIIIGTSLVVYPAAAYVRYFNGKHLILINRDATQYDSLCELVFNEDIIEVIKRII